MAFLGSPFLLKVQDARRRNRCDLAIPLSQEWNQRRGTMPAATFAALYGSTDPLAGLSCASAGTPQATPSASTPIVTAAPAIPVPSPGTPQQPGEYYTAAQLGNDDTDAARRACEIGQLGMRGRCSKKGYAWMTAPTTSQAAAAADARAAAYDPAPSPPVTESVPVSYYAGAQPPPLAPAVQASEQPSPSAAPLAIDQPLAIPSDELLRQLAGGDAGSFSGIDSSRAFGSSGDPIAVVDADQAAADVLSSSAAAAVATKTPARTGAGLGTALLLGAAALLLFGGGFKLGKHRGRTLAARELFT